MDAAPLALPADLGPLDLPGDRPFTAADQEEFTALSGDCNPIHLAAFAGRPGFADRAVVHGAHLALRTLDDLFAAAPALGPLAALKIRFEKTVHVGDGVHPVVARRETGRLRLNLMRGDARVASLHLAFGAPQPAPAGYAAGGIRPREPALLAFAAIAGFSARVPFGETGPALAARFPVAARAIGPTRVAGLAGASVVVGMVCPGLFSLFAGLDLAATEGGDPDGLQVRVADSDERFQRVQLAVAGGGWNGLLDTLFRPR